MGDYEWNHADRATHAIAIYEGNVSETASGFAGREPGTLARVDVTRTIKASPDVDTSRTDSRRNTPAVTIVSAGA